MSEKGTPWGEYMREMVFSGTGLEAVKEYIDEMEAEAEWERAVMFVVVEVAGDSGEEGSEAVPVLEEMVLVLWLGDSGGVRGGFWGAV